MNDREEDGGGLYVNYVEDVESLPEPYRTELKKLLESAQAAVEKVKSELDAILRLVKSMLTIVTLKHTVKRLDEYRFELNEESLLELDMLTTAFVIIYARLCNGNAGSGFGRKHLPNELREVHDQILDIRNKRFAHNLDHHSISNDFKITFKDNQFELQFGQTLGFHIGGDRRWHELVTFIDGLYATRLDDLKKKMEEKTGHKWVLPGPPAPDHKPYVQLAPNAKIIR